MSYSEPIKSITLDQPYETEILGLGEVYEIMSVEALRRKLRRKYHSGRLYLVSNSSHSGRGYALRELNSRLAKERIPIVRNGFVDSPPWSSRPLSAGNRKDYPRAIIFLAELIFSILIPWEFLWRGPRKSHMLYCFSPKR